MESDRKLSIPGHKDALLPRDRFAAYRKYFNDIFDSELGTDALTPNDVLFFKEFNELARIFADDGSPEEVRLLHNEIEYARRALQSSNRTKAAMEGV
jgi:hypothetical protein